MWLSDSFLWVKGFVTSFVAGDPPGLGNGEWQVNAKLPGELAVGRHAVRVRLATSGFSAEGWITRA